MSPMKDHDRRLRAASGTERPVRIGYARMSTVAFGKSPTPWPSWRHAAPAPADPFGRWPDLAYEDPHTGDPAELRTRILLCPYCTAEPADGQAGTSPELGTTSR